MFFKKYTSYLISYIITFVDVKNVKDKTDPKVIKASGRLIKTVKGKIKTSFDLVKVEAEIRDQMLRVYPGLRECYISHYQKIGKVRKKEILSLMKDIDLLPKESILYTLGKALVSIPEDKTPNWDKSDKHIFKILKKMGIKK